MPMDRSILYKENMIHLKYSVLYVYFQYNSTDSSYFPDYNRVMGLRWLLCLHVIR